MCVYFEDEGAALGHEWGHVVDAVRAEVVVLDARVVETRGTHDGEVEDVEVGPAIFVLLLQELHAGRLGVGWGTKDVEGAVGDAHEG